MNETTAEQDAERLLALLEAQHEFPGEFTFKVIYRNEVGLGDTIIESVCSGAGLARPSSPPPVKTSTGARFASMTLDLNLSASTDVLDVYAILQGIEGVISAF